MANERASENDIAKMLRAKRRKAGVTQSGAASGKGNADPAKARKADEAAKAKSRANSAKKSKLTEEQRQELISRRTDPSNPNFGRNESLRGYDEDSVFGSADDPGAAATDVTKAGSTEAVLTQSASRSDIDKALETPSSTKAGYSPVRVKGESNLAEDTESPTVRSLSGGGDLGDYNEREQESIRRSDEKFGDDTLKDWLKRNPNETLPAFQSQEQYEGWKRNVRVGRDVIGNGGAVSGEKRGEVRDRVVARERTIRSRDLLSTTQRRTVPSENVLSPSRSIPPSNPLTVADAKANQQFWTGEDRVTTAGAPMRQVVEQQIDGTFKVAPRPTPNRVTVQSLYNTKVKPAVREAKEAEAALATAEGLQKLDAYAQSPEAPRFTGTRTPAEIARLTEARLGNEEGTLDTENKRYVVDKDIGPTYPRTMTTREAYRDSGNPLTDKEKKKAFGVGPGATSTSGILGVGGNTKISSQFRETVAAKRAAADALTDKANPPKWGPNDERLTFEGVPTADVTTKEGQAAIIETTGAYKNPRSEIGIDSKGIGVRAGAQPSLGAMDEEENQGSVNLALDSIPGTNRTEKLRNYAANYEPHPTEKGKFVQLAKPRSSDQQAVMMASLSKATAGIKGGSDAASYEKGQQVSGEKPVWAGDEMDVRVENPLGFSESLRENRNTYWGGQAEANKRAAKAAGGKIQNQSAAEAAYAFGINESTRKTIEKSMMPGEGNTSGVAAGHLRAAIDPYRRPDSSFRLSSTGAAYVPDASPAGKKGWQGPTLAGHIQRAEDLEQGAAGAAIEHGEGSTPHRAALRAARGARRFAEMMDKTPGSRGGLVKVFPGGEYGRTPEGVEYSAGPGSDFEGQDQAQREQTRQSKIAGTFQRPAADTSDAEPYFQPSSAPGMARSDIRSDESGNLRITPIAKETKLTGLKEAKGNPDVLPDSDPKRAKALAKMAAAKTVAKPKAPVELESGAPASTSNAQRLANSTGLSGPSSRPSGFQSDYATSSYESNTMPLPRVGRSAPAAAGEVLSVGNRQSGVMVKPTSTIWDGADSRGIRRSTSVYGSPESPESATQAQSRIARSDYAQPADTRVGATGIRGRVPVAPPGYSASFGESPRSAGRRVASELSSIDAQQGRASSVMGGGQFNQ
jgi:hypothetical protein